MLRIIIAAFLLISFGAEASLNGAARAYSSRGNSAKKYRDMVVELVDADLHFAAIPFMKEYLVKTNARFDGRLERAFEEIVAIAGPRQFETLPTGALKGNKSNSLAYVLAKKYLRSEDYRAALSVASGINPNHPSYPFAANLMGAASSNIGKYDQAVSHFKDCQRTSESLLKKTKSKSVSNQLKVNHDYCVLGVARSLFAKGDYKEAELKYLDIPKSSPIWPEVLFEEAWNSYYLKNYNRTLGKLVTYKAPVFDYVFTPEIETLKALTYMKMCLYADAKAVSDGFYDKYLRPARTLRLYLKRYRKNYKLFYRLMLDYESSKKSNTPLMTTLLKAVSKDPAYLEIKESLILAAKEYEKLRSMGRSRFNNVLAGNLSETLQAQKEILGAFVKSRLVGKFAELYRAFEGMSYIKLEVLEQRKARLYKFDDKGRQRGDVKYIERNEKQYFWDFNGEFWADELGDYVFALGSEC